MNLLFLCKILISSFSNLDLIFQAMELNTNLYGLFYKLMRNVQDN